MSETKICFDMDGVLASFEKNVIKVANARWPGKLPEDYVPEDWDYKDKLTKEEWTQVWADIQMIPDFWMRQPEIPEAVEALLEYRQNSKNPIWFITSRIPTGGISARYQTQLWLMKHRLISYHNMETSRVIAVIKAEDKQKWIEEFKIDVSIDDLAPTVERHNKIQGHKAYLLRRPWNRHCIDQPTVHSVKEFLEKI
jgi:5'(3')-deoxyribonucleotidase